MITTEFLRAGKAIFTVDNGKGTHYTFRVKSGTDKYTGKSIFFVGLLTGPDNTRDYTCIGRIINNAFVPSKGAGFLKKQIDVVAWAFKMVQTGKDLPAGYSIEHAGHCCRCARLLTTLESITTGIGPECRKKMGLAA